MPTDPAVERRALALFQEALDQPEAERAAWIEGQCVGDAALQARVTAMCEADRLAALRTGGGALDAADEALPDAIGPYAITEVLGRGGMGTVYRAERMAGDFQRTVAIKRIKPGLLSDRLIERFERERQTLARLEHAHIARLYDGGAMPDGAPFLVMEYVDGDPILDWADDHAAPLDTRLALLADACVAVAYAHRNLIIHRDITPSNVLVTREGVVKLIDFGIARPVAEPADAQTEAAPRSLTGLSLTPGYAAPERARGAEATTLADIYSLGRLLKELIGKDSDVELAAIVAHATRERIEERYPTADALAADIAAYRERRPVVAMGRDRGYLWRTFFRRNRATVLTGAGALALLLAALIGTVWALGRAETARNAEAARFGQVRSLANYLLFDLNGRLARVAGNTGARVDLATQAQNYLSILLAASGQDRPDLKLETARGLVQLARVQGSPVEPNIGQPRRAVANLNAALGLLNSLDATNAGVASAMATAHALRGQILLNDEMRQDDAAKDIAAARKIADTAPVDVETSRAARRAEIDLADLGADPARLELLAASLEQDIARWPRDRRNTRDAAFDRALATYLKAQSVSERAKEGSDYGLPDFLAAEWQFDALVRSDPHDPQTLLLFSIMLKDAFAAASRRGAETTAARLIAKADAISERLIATDDRDQGVRKRAASIKEAQAQNLRDHDRFGEAIALQQRVLALRRANIAPDRNARRVTDLGFSQMILGIIARDAGRRELACSSWGDAAASLTELEGRGQLAGFVKDFLPGLRAKTRLCAAGTPLIGLTAPIR